MDLNPFSKKTANKYKTPTNPKNTGNDQGINPFVSNSRSTNPFGKDGGTSRPAAVNRSSHPNPFGQGNGKENPRPIPLNRSSSNPFGESKAKNSGPGRTENSSSETTKLRPAAHGTRDLASNYMQQASGGKLSDAPSFSKHRQTQRNFRNENTTMPPDPPQKDTPARDRRSTKPFSAAQEKKSAGPDRTQNPGMRLPQGAAKALDDLQDGRLAPEDYSPSSFVEKLLSAHLDNEQRSARQASSAMAQGGASALDVQALKLTLDSALNRLNHMESQIAAHLEEQMNNPQDKEEAYLCSVRAGLSEVRKLHAGTEKLEAKFHRASLSAVRTGETLSGLHKEKEIAMQALGLLRSFQDFKKLKEKRTDLQEQLPEVFRENHDEEHTAKVLMQLKALAEELAETEENRTTKKNIEEITRGEEKKLLRRFKELAKNGERNIDEMKECANVLVLYDGGRNLCSSYIAQLKEDNIGDFHIRDGTDLRKLFTDFSSVVKKVHPIIQTVLPEKMAPRFIKDLIKHLLSDETDASQGMDNQVCSLLARFKPKDERDISSLNDYLEILQTVEIKTKDFFQQVMANCKDWEQDQLDSMKAFIDNLQSTLFKDYRGAYSADELLLVSSCIDCELEERVNKMDTAGNKNKRPLVVEAVVQDSHKVIKVTNGEGCTLQSLLEFLCDGKIFSELVAVAFRSITRCRSMLAEDEEREKMVSSIYKLLSRGIVDCVLEPILLIASNLIKKVDKYDDHAHKDIYKVIELINGGTIHLQNHFRNTVLTEMQSFPTIKTIACEKHRKMMKKSEKCAVSALKAALETLVRSIEKILNSSTYRNAYLLEDAATLNYEPSKGARQIVKLLNAHHDSASSHLPDLDLSSMWASLSAKVYESFTAHLRQDRKIKITPTGALILHQDVDVLKEALLKLKNGEVVVKLNDLKAISQLYIVSFDNIKGITKKEPFASMRMKEIDEYARRRADYRTKWSKDIFGLEY